MSEDQWLEQKINESQEQFKRLSAVIEGLKKDYDYETRAEAKIRIKAQLEEREQERQTVEQRWQSLEAEQKQQQLSRLEQEARHLERNKAFKEALETWQEICRLQPDDPQIAGEIHRLEGRLQQSQRLTDSIRQLTHRLAEIKPIYPTVITRLREMGETGGIDEDLLSIVDDFLQGRLPAANFVTAWQALTTSAKSAKEEPEYHALADRLKRGEIVLFLGSDIPRLLGTPAPMETLAPELAQRANYQGYAASLPMIAEYYQMKFEYGRSTLVGHLKTIIGPAVPDISLYQLLARVEQPLVLISANYDLFLENQLRQAGRKYALIASIIMPDSDCRLGNVIVHYSDREAPECPRLEEKLSSLELIEKGYTLIYKIRGYCNAVHEQTAYQDNILALTEENYFTFARHMDRLIPNYVVKQFAKRGLFFLGYSPRHWEDRLLVKGILDKRWHPQYERAHVITEDPDPFMRAYWDSRGVHRYGLELAEFVRRLEEYLI